MSSSIPNRFDWPVRVYYEDTDGGGVVYHANYLKFMERARTEWLRSLGFEQTELRSGMNVLFVVRRLTLQYRLPAYFNDQLLVTTTLAKMGRSLLEFEQRILRTDSQPVDKQRNDEQRTDELTQAVVQVVSVDAAYFKPISIPSAIRNAIKTMEPEWT